MFRIMLTLAVIGLSGCQLLDALPAPAPAAPAAPARAAPARAGPATAAAAALVRDR